MKKYFITLNFLMLFILIGNSQTNKGNFGIGGSSKLLFNSFSIKEKSDVFDTNTIQKSSSFSISPNAGYFVLDNLLAGVGFSYVTSKSQYNNGYDIYGNSYIIEGKGNSITADVFMRYYFTKSSIKPFLEANVGFGNSKSSTEGYGEYKSNLFTYGFDGGIAIFLNNKVSLDIAVGYQSSAEKPKDNNDINYREITNVFGVGVGLNIFL